jgi:glycosyltransferase involved in cell wall biosynthesis
MLLVSTGLGPGGAERVIASLANAWSSRGHEIFILTLDDLASFYPLAPDVRRVSANLVGDSGGILGGLRANVDRVKALRRCIREFAPDVVIGFMARTGMVTILASLGLHVPTIVCEHNDPAQLQLGTLWSSLRVLTYSMADTVTFLTSNVVERWVPLLGSKAVLMPNPVVIEPPDASQSKRLFVHPQNLIAVGRLTRQKGFDLLLQAFQLVVEGNRQWGLTILGEGELRPQLERMIEKLGLGERVQLAGRVNNPFAWLRQADLFVMSSRFEGLPCSLCEAMACGLPAISFDCDSGPRDIIREGVDGLLVTPLQINELAAAMDRLMSHPGERAKLATRAPEVMQRYSMAAILQMWDGLFQQLKVRGHAASRETEYQLGGTLA